MNPVTDVVMSRGDLEDVRNAVQVLVEAIENEREPRFALTQNMGRGLLIFLDSKLKKANS